MKASRKLSRFGKYCHYVILPAHFIDHLKWQKGEEVEVLLEGNEIILRVNKKADKNVLRD